ncbi:MAG: M55 family metallopeptidase [Planctomycetota bacterium]
MTRDSNRREFLGAAAGIGIGSWMAGRAVGQENRTRTRPLSVYIMTDMEGVAGVLDSENWCHPESRYYELGKEFLTLEVNAAIEGFARGGATEFLVVDGHGHGAINPKLLDARAQLARNWARPPYPFSMERGMTFAAWVGQHAMSRSEFAHLAHTGSFGTFEDTINGRPVGEFGEVAFCASQLQVRTIFGAGDLAFTKEAAALVRGIETVAVKRGTTPGRGDECDREAYAKRNLGAIHFQPERARQMIRDGAERAIRRATSDASFGIIPLKPPFQRTLILRPQKGQPKRIGRATHADDVIALLNTPIKYEDLK